MEEIDIKAPEVGPNADALTSLTRGRGPRRGNLEDLLKYWRPIMKRPGGFRRCVVTLMDKPQFGGKPQRICAWLHHELTGKWPNEGKGKGKGRGGRKRGKLTRRVRRGRRGKSLDYFTPQTQITVNALNIAVRESREAKSMLTQPISGRQNAIDYKASLIRFYSSHVEVEGKTLEVDDNRLEVKRVGLFGSSSAAGQAVQAAGSIALPGDLSNIRSPIRSQIYEALTPGIPGRPRLRGRGALRRAGRGARNKFRCPPGFEKGGTFTNAEFSTCGAQILRIPNGLGGLAPDAQRSLARLSRDADLVRTIGDLRKNRNSADIIRAAQIPTAPKKVNATNMKKSTDYILSRIAEGEAATDRVVRRDGVILEPVVSTAALGGLDEFDDMADGSYIANSRSGVFGADDIPMFATGIRDIIFPIGDAGAVRLYREGGELSPEEREGLRAAASDAARSASDGADPTAVLREFVDNSDGRFALELLVSQGEGDTRDYVSAEERMNERIKVRSGSNIVIVPRWVYETFLSRGAPRRSPNDPIFELDEDENGGSKSASPFFSTDASRYNKRYDTKAYWFKRDVELKAKRPSAAVFDTNLGRYRCPPGTQNGGTFTDNAGTNCGGRVSDTLVNALSKLFDRSLRISDRTDKYGASYAKRRGLSSAKQERLDELTTLTGGVAQRTSDLVDDVGPVKLSELGQTIEDIQLRRSLSPDEARLANGDSLLAAATSMNLYITEELGDDVDDMSPEQTKQLIEALSLISTAEAKRRTISGSASDEGSEARNYAINSLLEEAAEFMVGSTQQRKKPNVDRDEDREGLPEATTESVTLQIEEAIGHAEVDDTADGLLAGLIMDEEDYAQVKETIDNIKADLLLDIGIYSESPVGTSERDAVEALLTRVTADVDPQQLNEDYIEERDFFIRILRDYMELDAISTAMEDPFDEADIPEISRVFSRTSEDTRESVTIEMTEALQPLTNDDLLAGLLAASGRGELDDLQQKQAQKRLLISADIPDFLPIEESSGLSSARKIKDKQQEKVRSIINRLYPNGDTPWVFEEDETLLDLVDIDRLLDPSSNEETLQEDIQVLSDWMESALRFEEEFELKSIDVPSTLTVAEGKTVAELYPEGLKAKLVTRLRPYTEGQEIFESGDDYVQVYVNAIWETQLIIEDHNGIRTVVMENSRDDDLIPGDGDVTRQLTLNKRGNISIDNYVFKSTDGDLKYNNNKRTKEYPLALVKQLFSSMGPVEYEGEKRLEISGYGLADEINLHAFLFYAGASQNAPKPADVTLMSGYDGAAIWGRKGFRDTRELHILSLNEQMEKLVSDYERNDDSVASRTARAVIKDDTRLARVKQLLDPFDRGGTGDALAGHGDFQLALDGEDGKPNSAAFFYFKANDQFFYTPKSRIEALREELGDDNELYELMTEQRYADVRAGKYSNDDFRLSDNARLSTASITIDHLDDIVSGGSSTTDTAVEVETPSAARDIRSTTVPNGRVFDIVPDRDDMTTPDQGVQFLEGGGSVAEVPDSILADTLIQAANDNNSPRFSGKGEAYGASSVIMITDNLTGVTYGIKGTDGLLFPNEAAAEVIGPNVAALLGFEMGSVRLGGSTKAPSSNIDFNPYETYPVVIQFADSMFTDWMSRSEPEDPHDTTGSKKSLARMMLLDLIISHRDRNPRNYGVGDGEYFPFDYGGSMALIEGEDRAYFNGASRVEDSVYLESKLNQAADRMHSPFFVYKTLVGERQDLTAAELADEIIEVLEELRTKDLTELSELTERLASMGLDEYRGSSFDRPVTSPEAVQKSYNFPVEMIQHLLSKDPQEIRQLIEGVHTKIIENKDSMPFLKAVE
jgi:hypothetical protein